MNAFLSFFCRSFMSSRRVPQRRAGGGVGGEGERVDEDQRGLLLLLRVDDRPGKNVNINVCEKQGGENVVWGIEGVGERTQGRDTFFFLWGGGGLIK